MRERAMLKEVNEKSAVLDDWGKSTRQLLEAQQRAFHVARVILHDAARAEDVVQDANERALAKLRTGFSPDDFNKWFISLVLNAARNQFRTERRRKRREDVVRAQTKGSVEPKPTADHKVLLAALAQLNEQERLSITLHHGLGYTQRQISKLLNISDRAVGYRIAAGLDRLRRTLGATHRSVSAAVLIEWLAQCVDHPAPSDLQARAHEAVHQASASSRFGSLPMLIPALIGSVLVVSSVFWLQYGSDEPDTPANPFPKGTSATKAPKVSKAAVPTWHDRRWTFEGGIPDGLRILSGDASVRPARVGKRATLKMAPSRPKGKSNEIPILFFQLNAPLPEAPVLLEVEGRMSSRTTWLRARLSNEEKLLTFRRSQLPRTMVVPGRFRYRCYLIGHHAIDTLNDQVVQIYDYGTRSYRENFCIASNVDIEEIRLRRIALDQIPLPYRDPVEFMASLKIATWRTYPERVLENFHLLRVDDGPAR